MSEQTQKAKLTGKQWLAILSTISVTTVAGWITQVGIYQARFEQLESDHKRTEVRSFENTLELNKGDRFTAAQGSQLERRIDSLEIRDSQTVIALKRIETKLDENATAVQELTVAVAVLIASDKD